MRDRGSGKQRIETTLSSEFVVVIKYMVDNLIFCERCAIFFPFRCFVAIIFYLETEHIVVVDGMDDGVLMQTAFEHIFGSYGFSHLTIDAHRVAILLKDRSASEAKELRFREEVAYSSVVFAKLATMTFVENEYHTLVAQSL